jgi:hypothetical protein
MHFQISVFARLGSEKFKAMTESVNKPFTQ